MSDLLSDRFKNLKAELCDRDFTINELLEKLGDKSHAVAIIILSAPFLLPVPIPGLSTIMGLLISWIAIYWLLQKKIWLPKKWATKTLPASTFIKVFDACVRYSKKIEFLFKARGQYLLDIFFVRVFIFILILVSALFLALPLPPGTNFPPAITIIILSLALLFDDFVAFLAGVFIFLVNLAVMFFALRFMCTQSLPYIKSIQNWL